jgi:hypothetical protein
LEALFLHLGPNNPDLPARINVFRGIEQFEVEEVWKWLFFQRRTAETIEMSSLDDENIRRTLRIRLVEPEISRISVSANGDGASAKAAVNALTTAVWPRELTLEYWDTTGQQGVSRLFVTSDEVKAERARLAPFPLGVFVSTRTRAPKEDAMRFSNLERVGRQDEIILTLQILEPRLRRLAVLVTGGAPMIWGDLGMGELVPLPLMGEGMGRLISVLLAIANAPHGTILVDEIENGLHYSVMTDVWRAIADAARRSDTQVFATTHNWECIRAAYEAFATDKQYDFRLHRLDRQGDDIQAVTYDQKMLALALDSGLEVR